MKETRARVIPLDSNWHETLSTKTREGEKYRKSFAKIEADKVLELVKIFDISPRTRASRLSSPNDRLWKIDEIAHHAKVNRSMIYKAIYRGELIAERIGRVYRISQLEWDAYKMRCYLKHSG